MRQKTIKMRCKKEERDGIAYHWPTIPCAYEEGSLNLQMLLPSPKCDNEPKKKNPEEERNLKINFPTWHILKGTVNLLYNYISKSLEDYTEGWTLQNLNIIFF